MKLKQIISENRVTDFDISRADTAYNKAKSAIIDLVNNNWVKSTPAELKIYRSIRDLLEKSELESHWKPNERD